MPRRSRLILTAVGAFALAAAAVTTTTGDAAAAVPQYVALGDSYASGTGTGDYIDDSNCLRSAANYSSLIAAARGYDLNLRACSGAEIPDVRGQLGALSASTDYVSLSVGGNDAGFSEVITECAKPGWLSDCNSAIDGAQSIITGTLPDALSGLYADVRAHAPRATVVIVGYPRLFMGEDCNALTWFSPDEQDRLTAMADLLRSEEAAAAASAGFGFADPIPSFVGHAVCDDPEWLNGLSKPIVESYHPNKLGHADGFTPLVSAQLTGVAATADPAVLATAAAAAPAQAHRQQQYAAGDASIRPEVIRAPDLSTPEARAAAARAGVDLNSRASIDRADRIFSAQQAAAVDR